MDVLTRHSMLSPRDIFSRLTPAILFCWQVLSACLTAWFLAWGLWQVTRNIVLPIAPPITQEQLKSNVVVAVSTSAILQRNLMQLAAPVGNTQNPQNGQNGQQDPMPTKKTPAHSDDLQAIPHSRRGWQLLGTVASSVPLEGHAALLVDGKQRLLREGEMLQDWLVERVIRKTVILHKDGVREKLVLELPPQEQVASSTVPVQAAPTQARPAGSQPLAAALADPSVFLRDVAFKPKSLGSRQGMEITALRAESLLHNYGLRTGDVVLQVNGVPVRTYEDLPALLQALKSDTLRVYVSRFGKELILE